MQKETTNIYPKSLIRHEHFNRLYPSRCHICSHICIFGVFILICIIKHGWNSIIFFHRFFSTGMTRQRESERMTDPSRGVSFSNETHVSLGLRSI